MIPKASHMRTTFFSLLLSPQISALCFHYVRFLFSLNWINQSITITKFNWYTRRLRNQSPKYLFFNLISNKNKNSLTNEVAREIQLINHKKYIYKLASFSWNCKIVIETKTLYRTKHLSAKSLLTVILLYC